MMWVFVNMISIDEIMFRLDCIDVSYDYLYLFMLNCWYIDEWRIMALWAKLWVDPFVYRIVLRLCLCY